MKIRMKEDKTIAAGGLRLITARKGEIYDISPREAHYLIAYNHAEAAEESEAEND
jgi:hypothetical protein